MQPVLHFLLTHVPVLPWEKRSLKKKLKSRKTIRPKRRGMEKCRTSRDIGKENIPCTRCWDSSKTVVLETGSQFRPGPPPDYAKDMAELKNFKRPVSVQCPMLFFGEPGFLG